MKRLLMLCTFAIALLVPAIACQDGAEEDTPVGAEAQRVTLDDSDTAPPAAYDPGPPPTVQSEKDAIAEDAALVAAARGWTMDQVMTHLRASEIVGRLSQQISESRPEIFVGSMLSEDPEGAPTIFIKGPADDWVKGLVADAEIKVILADDQPYSRQEMDERQQVVMEALIEMGFQNAAVGSRIDRRGRIEAEVGLEAGLPDDPDAIMAGIPEWLRSEVDVVVVPDGAWELYYGTE